MERAPLNRHRPTKKENDISVHELQPSLFTLDTATAEAIRTAALAITADANTEPDEFGRQALAASFALPEEVRAALLNFSDVGSDTGILVVRGLIVDSDLVDTPLDNKLGIGATTVFAKEMAVLAHVLGSMVAYEAEGNGHLIQDMVPNPKLATTQQSQGSKVELEAHTEQCFSNYKPDYVILGALRGDPEALTYAFSGRKIAELMSPEEVAMLRKPLWATTIDESFQPYIPNPDEIRGPFAILNGPDDDPYVLVDQDLMHGITAAAQELLQKVVKVYIEHRDAHNLQAGDLLMLDNLRAMHGRSMYTPRFDGKDRFIARGFVVRDRRRLWPQLLNDRRTVGAVHS
ncbi:MAG: TauD/TfdA family dioxygenase [Rhodoglobus sp.]|uniref:TauD/TfdA family dioxygenase n=1 Tax=Salinibacterium sp. G-O1 TaxID=3046208 RepID=UPI0024BBABC9|nr:TauD/TfdA family dioxygenase [Salinibacterium sp. G-O1]MDJ0334569.1 TauD/TfdA family dioxygenase [Salinibacterium sp. G-O1]